MEIADNSNVAQTCWALTKRDDAMKITDSVKNITGLSVGSGVSSKAKSPDKSAGTIDTSEADLVKISPLSSQLQSLQAQISTSSAFDSRKVEEIKRAIAGGQFQVDTEKVANELITSVKNLLQSRNGQA
ncbi:MAG: flagellar biosynthesis anti-sigma factor FlgM [Sulfuriferula sp.]